ncbi:MAG: hypothetical protein COW12_05870 [Candidatus Omnitrophica bacterium CG12_big_fil_rev_8_21_14_0_65_45_16]|nr:MAG: hypothetical protein COW12_05870 [Candidatus Omnitrophica bacterium CG12_big_fil_rev_8_21_14_0_65_45_16]
MNRTEIKQQLIEIFSVIFDLTDQGEIERLEAAHSEKWDSLNHLNLMTAIEQKFEIELTPDEMDLIHSFDLALSVTQEKIQEKLV